MVFGPTLTPLDFGGVTALDPDDASLPSQDLWLRADSTVKGASLARLFDTANDERLVRAATDSALSPGAADFSMAGWFYMDSKATGLHVLGKWDADPLNEYFIRYESGANRMQFYVSHDGTASANVQDSVLGSPSTGTWYFIYCYHDNGTEIGMQINNGAASTTAHTTGVAQTATPFWIGARGDSPGSQHWDGRLARWGFWQRLLTTDELTWLYNAGAGRYYSELGQAGDDGANLKSNLSAFWNLRETSGDAIDSHTNSLDLTDTNTVLSAAGPDDPATPAAGDGQEVVKWISSDPNAYEFTEATNKPTYTESAIGGRGAVTFDGVDDLLSIANSVSTATSGTLMAVIATTEYDGTAGIADSQFASTSDTATDNFNWKAGVAYSDTIGKYGLACGQTISGTTRLVADSNTDVFAGVKYIVTISSNGTTTTMRVRGRAGVVTDITLTDQGNWLGDVAGRDNFVLGALKNFSGESEHFHGSIADLVVYSQPLTAAQILGVEKGYSEYYTLSLGYATTGVPKMLTQGKVADSPAWIFTSVNTNFYGPRVVKNSLYTGGPAATFSCYYSSDHSAGNGEISKFEFDYPMGTWTDEGSALFSAAGQIEVPLPIVDTVNDKLLLFPHGNGQAVHKLHASDGETFTNDGKVFDTAWSHEGYGAAQEVSGRIWQIGYSASPQNGGQQSQQISDDWGDSFQHLQLTMYRRNWLRPEGSENVEIQSVFDWRGTKYARCSGGFVEWDWTNRIQSEIYDWSAPLSGVDPSDSPSLTDVFIDDTGADDLLYLVYVAYTSTYVRHTNNEAAFFLAAPDMFEAQTATVTPSITVSSGKIAYTTTATTTVVDWDATAETLPAATMEIIETTGTHNSSWSSGNYYQFECNAVECDIRLRSKSTVDPTQFYIVDFILEGLTNEGTKATHPLADAHWSFEATDGATNNGVRINYRNSRPGGEMIQLNGGSATTTYDAHFNLDENAHRVYEMDLTIRIFDYGTKCVLVHDGDEGSYWDLSTDTDWSTGVYFKIRIENENTFPAKWIRLKRFAVKTGGPL